MSTRGYISSFSLEKLRSLLGSGDARVVAEAEAAAEARIKHMKRRSPDHYRQAKEAYAPVLATVARAVAEGAPLKGVKAEGEEHATAATLLASIRQKPRPTEFEDWKVVWTFPEFLDDFEAHVPKPARKLIDHFMNGRPLLGKTVSPEVGGRYAWLPHAEVVLLHASLVRLREAHATLRDEDYIDGFFESFVGSLAEVAKRRADLWYHAG